MKTLLALLSIVFAASAFAEDLRTVKTADLAAIAGNTASYEGQIVKIKFGWRDGTKLAYRESGKNYKIEAVVPAEGAQWFSQVTPKTFSTSGVFVFARIAGGKAELLGREVRHEASGSKLIW